MRTKTFSTILLDDEELALSALNHLINDLCPELKIERVFTDPLKACKYLKNNEVDIAFIDIRMPGKNGLDLVKSLDKFKTKFIFSTAFSEFALEAWQTEALGYLQKPIDPDDLVETVKKVTKIIRPEPDQKFFTVAKTELNIEKLMFGESAGSYTKVIYSNNKSFTFTKNLQKIIDALPCNKVFRVSREAFINAMFLDSYDVKNRIVTLTNAKTFSVSVRRASEFLEFLKTNNYTW